MEFDLQGLYTTLQSPLNLITHLLVFCHLVHGLTKLFLQGPMPVHAVLGKSLFSLFTYRFQRALKGLHAILHSPLKPLTCLPFLCHVLHGLVKLFLQGHMPIHVGLEKNLFSLLPCYFQGVISFRTQLLLKGIQSFGLVPHLPLCLYAQFVLEGLQAIPQRHLKLFTRLLLLGHALHGLVELRLQSLLLVPVPAKTLPDFLLYRFQGITKFSAQLLLQGLQSVSLILYLLLRISVKLDLEGLQPMLDRLHLLHRLAELHLQSLLPLPAVSALLAAQVDGLSLLLLYHFQGLVPFFAELLLQDMVDIFQASVQSIVNGLFAIRGYVRTSLKIFAIHFGSHRRHPLLQLLALQHLHCKLSLEGCLSTFHSFHLLADLRKRLQELTDQIPRGFGR
mmetsp:Transcript_127288/g.231715  ORF Transcript_127288/g.231715 Transcript_127288/m.231715 type:complete len:392 (-) Transcript_127288:401-1576(-)